MGVDAEMVVRLKRTITDNEIARVGYEMVAAFGTRPFLILDGNEGYSSGRPRYALQRVVEHDALIPAPGETLLEVSLMGRYYGVGYERGDLPTLIMIAEYLEQKIPGADIWYGGDTGAALEPFGKVERAELFAHFVEHGHAPYLGGFDHPGVDEANPLENPVCAFCNRRMLRNGWGGRGLFAAFHCPGCGQSKDTHDGGVTWKQKTLVGGDAPREESKAG